MRRSGFGSILATLGVLLALVGVLAMFSATARTDANEIGLVYGGGLFEGRQFQQVIEPGTGMTFVGWFDPMYTYPVTQRDYIVSQTEGDVVGVIQVPSKDGQKVDFEVATYFRLNTDLLREFHEDLGLKFRAWTNEGWNEMLSRTLLKQIELSLTEEALKWTVEELWSSEKAFQSIQTRIGTSLNENITQMLGKPYFCGVSFVPGSQVCPDFTFVIKSRTPQPDILEALENNRTSQINVQTRINETAQAEEQAKAIQALTDALEGAGGQYPLLKAVESGKVTFWVIDGDQGLTITGPPASSPPSQPVEPPATTTTTVAP